MSRSAGHDKTMVHHKNTQSQDIEIYKPFNKIQN